ncbi:porin [Comamonas testosteroni]|uniref:Membrane protein n=1 Tax=Comamonas testosteroni TaxID=285 RepID=A0A096GS95_COMTE|nr:porin [Comamonas testosteroni]KGH28025.1 membrane protein [Comamonas testosteroni]
MKHTIHPLTICTVIAVGSMHAGIAQAQNSVTLYGLIDASVRYEHTNKDNVTSVVDGADAGWGGSRWGFLGSEDLGGGLKAIMNLEGGFNIDTGMLRGGKAFGRTAMIGLAGQYGEITLGRQYNALYYTGAWHSDPTYVSSWSPSVVHQLDFAWDNAIAYTGRFGNYIARATFAPGEQNGSSGNRQAASLLYNGHPFGLAVGYGSSKNNNWSTANIGAYYEIGKLTVQATYYRTRNDPYSGAHQITTQGLGGFYQLTPEIELTAGFWHTKNDLNSGAQHVRKGLIAARYSLSKRTRLYAEADHSRSDGEIRRKTGVQMGIRHSF